MMHGFAVPEATQHHYKSLYSFKAPPDGAQPIAGLVTFKGTLYGTTYTGGLQESYGSLGTVFSITKKGNERVLYDFTPLTAWNPSSDLVALRGVLYGVASGGGYNQGVVYRTATSGRERILYSFKGIPDGSAPVSSLIALDGTLYGETVTGGTGHCDGPAVGCGTVFELSTSGAERVLYNFPGGSRGRYPVGNLVAVNDTLYGTTVSGGDRKGCFAGSCGTVFSVSTSGEEHVLYKFKGPPDGELTQSSNGLVVLNNVLYGTAAEGGTRGFGAVYSVDLSGKETILHSFDGGANDGNDPSARLEVVNGVLYGTTFGGGETGRGTVFKINTSGAEQLLYSFAGTPDGSGPLADLTLADSKLYGTTSGGGSESAGTVFRISP
jgi:uncharacterized repeat protein (TIGR03803 family)